MLQNRFKEFRREKAKRKESSGTIQEDDGPPPLKRRSPSVTSVVSHSTPATGTISVSCYNM